MIAFGSLLARLGVRCASPCCWGAPSLGVEEEAGDEDDDNRQELEEPHSNERVGEEIFLHRWVACHAYDERCEKLANPLRAAADSDHGDGAAEHRHAGVTGGLLSAEANLGESRLRQDGPGGRPGTGATGLVLPESWGCEVAQTGGQRGQQTRSGQLACGAYGPGKRHGEGGACRERVCVLNTLEGTDKAR